MNDNNQIHLVALLEDRARSDYEIEEGSPDSFVSFLIDNCFMEKERAESLAWSEDIQLHEKEVEDICYSLSLHEPLFVALHRKFTREALQMVLEEIGEDELNSFSCPDCSTFQEELEDLEELDDEDIVKLSLAILNHIIIIDEEEIKEIEEIELESNNLIKELLSLYVDLDEEAQKRVVSYAHSERMKELGMPTFESSTSYKELRDNLTPLVRSVLDLLASSPQGQLDEKEIVQRLSLKSSRSLSKVINLTSEKCKEKKINLANPVIRQKNGQFVMNEDLLHHWKNLI